MRTTTVCRTCTSSTGPGSSFLAGRAALPLEAVAPLSIPDRTPSYRVTG